MARKKKSLPKVQRAEWSTSDTITLLAWLDHTLKHKELKFNTVISRLNHAYTISQVNRRLSRLWEKHGPEDKPSWPPSLWKDDIFKDGSACLASVGYELEESILERISKASRKLEDEYQSRQVKSVVRRLRSISRQVEFPLLRPRAGVAEGTFGINQEQQMIPSNKSSTPSAIKREVGPTDSSADLDMPANKRQRQSEKGGLRSCS